MLKVETKTQVAQAPIDRITLLLKHTRSIKSARGGVTAQCPAHHDTENSLMVWEDDSDHHVGVLCFAGCSRSAICTAWGIEETDLYVQDGRPQQPKKLGLSLMDLCKEKWIHPRDLEIMQLGITEGLKYEGRSAVRIPYYHMDGTEHTRYRIRTDISAKKGSKWSPGDDDLIPYGLQRLADARAAKYLVIVEGESDCWTLWGHRFPALGIPGAKMASKIQMEYLTGIEKVFILQEPDPAGQKFASDIRKRLREIGYKRRIHTLNFQELTGAKDPNELHKKDVKAFPEAFKAAMARVEPPKPKIQRLQDLQKTILPETKWAIDPLLPEGVTILGGKPKLGKSWLALSMQLAISSGGAALGKYPVERGEVLYISLEDNDKRLQKRSNQLLRNALASPDFYYATEWPRLNEGGYELIEEYINEHPSLKLIVIDPWARIKPKTNTHQSQQYDDDYEAITPLQKLAGEKGISILIIDHMRKTEAEDPLDMIAGSVGKTGAVDGFLLLYRKRGESDARLFVTGRDIEEEQELLLSFNQEASMWTVKGDADDVTLASTPQQQEILDALAQAEHGLTVKALAEKLEKNVNTTRNLLQKLRNHHQVTLKNNVYSIVTIVSRSKDSNHSNHSKLNDFEVATETREHSNHSKLDDSEVTLPEKQVTTDATEHSNHSNPRSNPLSQHEKPIKDTSDDEVTTLTTDTMQNQPLPLALIQEYRDLYKQLQQIPPKKLAPLGTVHWYVPDSEMATGPLSPHEYALRLQTLGKSTNLRKVTAGRDEMLRKLEAFK
jgi:Fe2+ or Zn2+ uptake regulation protein